MSFTQARNELVEITFVLVSVEKPQKFIWYLID